MEIKTMRDALEEMEMSGSTELQRWKALAIFLRELALSNGTDLDHDFTD